MRSTGSVLVGTVMVLNGDCGIAANAPEVELIAKTETVLVDAFVTYMKCSAGSIANEEGDGPTRKGDPATACNAAVPDVIA